MIKKNIVRLTLAFLVLAVMTQLSCGGHGSPDPSMASTGPGPGPQPGSPQDMCSCTNTEPASSDFRTDAKHVDLPQIAATNIAVADMLKWAVPPEPAFGAPRVGIELQMFHIPNGFLQLARVNPGDCDLHLEISDSPDKNAPRVIVETPHMDSFCAARLQLAQKLSAQGFTLSATSGELATAVAVDVVGLAFQDFNHPRGSTHVATVWELHPAVVTVK